MGAIARQVLQVKRKNSTKCSPPDARLTVVGSVAWSSGPREVAAGGTVASEGADWVAASSVGSGRAIVGCDAMGGGDAGADGSVEAAPGEQADRRRTIKLILGKMCFFIMFSLECYSTKSLHKY